MTEIILNWIISFCLFRHFSDIRMQILFDWLTQVILNATIIFTFLEIKISNLFFLEIMRVY